MFNKNSAFSTEPEVDEHLRAMRTGRGEEPRPDHQEKKSTEKESAYSLLTAARMMLDIESYGAAGELIDEAIASLEE